jgi:hypothetical protein
LKDAGHGLDGAAEFASGADEDRQDELGGAQLGFADQAAEGGGLAQSPGPVSGELSDKVHGDMLIQNRKLKIKNRGEQRARWASGFQTAERKSAQDPRRQYAIALRFTRSSAISAYSQKTKPLDLFMGECNL